MARRIRIVVGEGRTAQRGLLRFVLEGEGFDVVGEAKSSADLSGAIDAQRPDVVVLDDGIGVTAVSMVHEVHPQAKVVLVWPSFVVPIGGDARVEPAKILRDLGPAVEHVMGVAAGLTAFERPDWIDKVRKDPATLRDKLLHAGTAAVAAAAATKRPSVTSLQKRGKRLHPTGRRSKQTDPERKDGIPAPIILLPGAGSELEPVLDIGGGSASDAGSDDEVIVERSEWNRRLGTLALSGAAAVSALVLALALGGGRIPASVVRGGGVLPPGVPGFVWPGTEGPFGAGSLGGSGYNPVPSVEQPGGPDQGANGGTDGGLAAPGAGGSDVPAPAPGDGGTGGGGGGGTGGGGTGGGGGGGTGGGGTGGGGTGGGGGGVKGADSGMPGKSAEHNPHGGPPSKLGLTPAHGQGLGVGVGSSKESKPKHAHKH
jgi:hypothetical protein